MKKVMLFITMLLLTACMSYKSEGTSIKREEETKAKERIVQEELVTKLEEEKLENKDLENENTTTVENEVIQEKERTKITWKIIRSFEEKIGSVQNLKYKGELPVRLNYVIVLSQRVNLREKPTTNSMVVSSAENGERFEVLELVESNEDQEWYKIKKDDKELFVYKKIVAFREFRFEKAEEKIKNLESFIDDNISEGKSISSVNAYIPNPKNKNLLRNRDKYGNVQDQSAVGYYEGSKVYVTDRTIVAIEKEIDGRYRVIKQGGDEPYLDITKRKVDRNLKIESMPRKVVVIDIANQNFTVYEKEKDEWELISYAYSKTGIESKIGFKTPRGFFIVPRAKQLMTYNDSKGKKQGYAQYAIRFSGGGYIHGTPFNLKEKDELEKFRKQRESTLGSYPGTRKCVRNTLDHAQFLFDWVVGSKKEEGKNFQGIEENVVVIVM